MLRRTLTIFALGLFLTIFPYFGRDYSTLRIMGVLQRIAIAYFIGSVICLTVRRDYLWIVIAVVLLVYWALLGFFGGSDPFSLENNVASRVDALLLGENHLYKGFGRPFDPEGLLSTIPAVCTVLIGYYVGEILGSNKGNETILKLLLFGIASTGLGLLWGLVFPINKPLWTSSYVLYTAGLAMALLALIYFISDVMKLQKWGMPFMVFGTNALFSYFLAGVWTRLMIFIKIPAGESEISLYNWIYEKICVPVAGNLNGSLMFAILQVLLIWTISYILYRKKIFIRL
jgi:predicted acyltransferase